MEFWPIEAAGRCLMFSRKGEEDYVISREISLCEVLDGGIKPWSVAITEELKGMSNDNKGGSCIAS